MEVQGFRRRVDRDQAQSGQHGAKWFLLVDPLVAFLCAARNAITIPSIVRGI